MNKFNMKNLFMNVVLKWRLFLIVVIALGLAGAGLGVYKAKTGDSVEKVVVRNDIDEKRKNELNVIAEQLSRYHTSYIQLAEYLDNSVLINLDAMSVSSVKMTFNVEYDQYDNLYDSQRQNPVLVEYGEITKSYEFFEILKEKLGWDLDIHYVSELIAYGKLSGNILSVTVFHSDRETAEQFAEVMRDYIYEKQKDVESKLGEFKLTILETNYNEKVRTDYITKKNEVLNSQKTAKNNIVALTKELKDIELAYVYKNEKKYIDNEERWNKLSKIFNFESVGKYDEKAETITVIKEAMTRKDKIVTVIIWASIFAGGGLVVLLLVAIISFTLTNKLRLSEDMVEGFAVPLIGNIYLGEKKGLDARWLKKFRKEMEYISPELIDFYAEQIKTIVLNNTDKNVVIVSTINDDKINDIASQLDKKLNSREIETGTCLGSKNVDMVSKLKKDAYVLMLELQGKSKYRDIAELVDICDRCQAKHIGAIVVDVR